MGERKTKHSFLRTRYPLRDTRRFSRGMTLIEAVVWISMFTAAMLAIISSVLYFYRTSNYAIQEATAITSAQRSLDLLVRTLREASYASNGAYPVVAIATSSVSFYAEVDGDSGVERIRYYLADRNLVRGIVEPTGDPSAYTGLEATSTVAEQVRNDSENVSMFTYFDKNGAQISDYTRVADVRFVTISISVDIDPNRTPTTTKMRSSAALRNLIGR